MKCWYRTSFQWVLLQNIFNHKILRGHRVHSCVAFIFLSIYSFRLIVGTLSWDDILCLHRCTQKRPTSSPKSISSGFVVAFKCMYYLCMRKLSTATAKPTTNRNASQPNPGQLNSTQVSSTSSPILLYEIALSPAQIIILECLKSHTKCIALAMFVGTKWKCTFFFLRFDLFFAHSLTSIRVACQFSLCLFFVFYSSFSYSIGVSPVRIALRCNGIDKNNMK